MTGVKPKRKTFRFDRLIALGVFAGGAVLVGSMLLLAAIAIGLGWIRTDDGRWVDLSQWMVIQVVFGFVVSVLAGWICRNISLRYFGPAVLALVVFSIGLIEAIEVLRSVEGNTVVAPAWLVVGAPFIAALGIMLGGFRLSQGDAALLTKFRSQALWRYAVPTTVLLAASLLALFLLPIQDGDSRTTVLASALVLDMTVVFPGLVYFLLINVRQLPWITLMPAVAIGYLIAVVSIPGPQQTLFEYLRLLVIPAEFAIVAYVLVRTRREYFANEIRSGDFVTRLRAAIAEVLGNRIALGILTTEIAILYYAFKLRGSKAADPNAFTAHRRSGYGGVLIGLFLALFFEAIAMHFLLVQWSSVAAWILTGLTGYAVIWCVGDYRAFTLRPVLLTPTDLHLRVGLRWEVSVAIDSIHEVIHHTTQARRSSDALNAVMFGMPNLSIKLTRPAEAIGMYGIKKNASEIWIQVDDPETLVSALQVRTANRC